MSAVLPLSPTAPEPPPPPSPVEPAEAAASPTPEATERLLSSLAIEAVESPDEPPLTPRQMAIGVLGYVALPVVALLDVGGVRVWPAAIAPPIAALFLSVPSLLVGHQYLGLHADPRELLADIGRVFVLGGRLALGVVPAVGLYAATTHLGPVALAVALTVIGLGSVEMARRRLLRREALQTGDRSTTSDARRRMTLLATAWAALSLLIGGRLGLALLTSF